MASTHQEPLGESLELHIVDAAPTAGLAAPAGSVAYMDDGSGSFNKFGAGANDWHTPGGSIQRFAIAAESALTGAGMGATTPTAHTSITLSTALLNTARRTIRFKALLHCVDDNAADTWETSVALGAAGVAAAEIYTTGAINNVTGDLWEIRGEIYIATVGAGGTFHSVVHGELETGPADNAVYTTSTAINTTVARDLTVIAESSTNNADQEITLVHFEAEVMVA